MNDQPASPSTPAGWYPDHTGAAQLRWWDGTSWTDHVSVDRGVTATSPGSGTAQYSPMATPTKVPAGTEVYNVFIWIMTLLPLVGIGTLLTVNVSRLLGSPNDPFALYRDPAYLAGLGLAWVAYGVAVILAYLDRKRLLKLGYDRPFHWAWTFFNSGVYVIGRSVIVRRRAGRGWAPIWVWIGVSVLVFVVSLVRIAQLIGPLMTGASTAS